MYLILIVSLNVLIIRVLCDKYDGFERNMLRQ